METKKGFSCTVDYDIPFDEMLDGGGVITEQLFPKKGSGKKTLNFELVRFDFDDFGLDYVGYHKAVEGLRNCGLRPVGLVELLAFASAFPDEQMKHTIIELGSVVFGSLRVSTPHLYAVGVGKCSPYRAEAEYRCVFLCLAHASGPSFVLAVRE